MSTIMVLGAQRERKDDGAYDMTAGAIKPDRAPEMARVDTISVTIIIVEVGAAAGAGVESRDASLEKLCI